MASLTFDQAGVGRRRHRPDFPDALAGSFLAGRLGGPILLVERDGVPQPTLDTLDDLAVDRVVLLGGTDAIGQGVAEELRGAGYRIERRGS